MSTQVADSAVSELEAFFLRRNDIINRWGNIIASYQALPGLVSFWPMSSVQRSTGNVYDLSGQNRTLTYNGNPTFNIYNGLSPYIDLDGVGDFLSRADEIDLDILGTEAIYASGVRGLTLGGWFWFDVLTANKGIMSKWGVTNVSGGYMIYIIAASRIEFIVENSAGALSSVDSPALSTGSWYFVVGRFIPSTSMDIWINSTKSSNAAAIVTNIRNNAIQFEIGNWSTLGAGTLDGRAALCFLCANALPDTIINSLFEQTRLLFGQ